MRITEDYGDDAVVTVRQGAGQPDFANSCHAWGGEWGEVARFGSHAAMGKTDLDGFVVALAASFGTNPEERPFVVEQYDRCVVINYPNPERINLVPKVAGIGRRLGLNASEF